MTVKEMKEWLNSFDDDIPVVLGIEDKNTNSGTYISVCAGSKVEEVIFEEENERDKYLVLVPCLCHVDETYQPIPEAINPN